MREGISLAAQRAKVEAYAALYDLDLVEIVEEVRSAKNLDRPVLQDALRSLARGEADGLLVARLDRLTRSVRDLGDLIETYFSRSPGPALLSVGDQIDTRSAAGRLVLHILAHVSQWERETIGERTSAAIRHMRSEGLYTGGEAPYGYQIAEAGADDRSHLAEVPEEQEVISTARALRAAGLSLRKIAREIDRRGFVARNGHRFGAEQVRRMVVVG